MTRHPPACDQPPSQGRQQDRLDRDDTQGAGACHLPGPEQGETCIVPVDIARITLDSVAMEVTLTKDLVTFIAQKVRSGGYTDSSEVVREALRHLRAQDDPPEADSRELADLLLAAVRGPHRPLTNELFNQLRLRARRKSTHA